MTNKQGEFSTHGWDSCFRSVTNFLIEACEQTKNHDGTDTGVKLAPDETIVFAQRVAHELLVILYKQIVHDGTVLHTSSTNILR